MSNEPDELSISELRQKRAQQGPGAGAATPANPPPPRPPHALGPPAVYTPTPLPVTTNGSPPYGDNGSDEPRSTFDFRNFYYTIVDKAWLIALCLIAAGFVTAAYVKRAPRIHAAKAILKVDQEQPRILNIDSVVREDVQGAELLKNIEQMLQSRSLFERVIDSNNLARDPRFIPQSLESRTNRARLVARLATMVRASLQVPARTITVTVEHEQPALAALLANSLVTEVVRLNAEGHFKAAQMANAFLSEEAERLKRKLEVSENSLNAYKEKMVSLEARQAILETNLKDAHHKLTEAKAKRIQLEEEYARVQQMGTNYEALLGVPSISVDTTVAALRINIANKDVELANLKQRYKPKHPKYIRAESELEQLRQLLQTAIVNASRNMPLPLENSRAAEVAAEKTLAEHEKAATALSSQFIPYNVLLRDIESDRALYDSVVRRMKETSITSNLDNTRTRIFQLADRPERPVKPNVQQVIIIGLAAGLLVGVGLALLLGTLDRSLKTLREAELYLRTPVLTTVPKLRGLNSGRKFLVMTSPDQPYAAECFRSLRTSLTMLDWQNERRSFLLTSALPEEGKTFCSLNFAVSLSQQGFRTLLIDCDLRRPKVEQVLLGQRGKLPGVTDFLRDKCPFEGAVHEHEIERFAFMPAGHAVSNPSELLGHSKMADLIRMGLQRFDRVVIDSAPLYGISDSLLIVSRVQAVCMVVRAGRTPKEAALRGLELLHKAGAPLAGVILNSVPRNRKGDYSDPYYDYGYKYAETEATA